MLINFYDITKLFPVKEPPAKSFWQLLREEFASEMSGPLPDAYILPRDPVLPPRNTPLALEGTTTPVIRRRANLEDAKVTATRGANGVLRRPPKLPSNVDADMLFDSKRRGSLPHLLWQEEDARLLTAEAASELLGRDLAEHAKLSRRPLPAVPFTPEPLAFPDTAPFEFKPGSFTQYDRVLDPLPPELIKPRDRDLVIAVSGRHPRDITDPKAIHGDRLRKLAAQQPPAVEPFPANNQLALFDPYDIQGMSLKSTVTPAPQMALQVIEQPAPTRARSEPVLSEADRRLIGDAAFGRYETGPVVQANDVTKSVEMSLPLTPPAPLQLQAGPPVLSDADREAIRHLVEQPVAAKPSGSRPEQPPLSDADIRVIRDAAAGKHKHDPADPHHIHGDRLRQMANNPPPVAEPVPATSPAVQQKPQAEAPGVKASFASRMVQGVSNTWNKGHGQRFAMIAGPTAMGAAFAMGVSAVNERDEKTGERQVNRAKLATALGIGAAGFGLTGWAFLSKTGASGPANSR